MRWALLALLACAACDQGTSRPAGQVAPPPCGTEQQINMAIAPATGCAAAQGLLWIDPVLVVREITSAAPGCEVMWGEWGDVGTRWRGVRWTVMCLDDLAGVSMDRLPVLTLHVVPSAPAELTGYVEVAVDSGLLWPDQMPRPCGAMLPAVAVACQ